jgi:hypothetical protein
MSDTSSTQPAEPEQIADRIRSAIAEFNAASEAARVAGLRVNFAIRSGPCATISDCWVEVPTNWETGERGRRL